MKKTKMRYATVCSGIEAMSLAWEPMGWQPAWFSEIDKFPSAVLAHRWPGVVNRGDMTKYQEWPNETIDIIGGGTPCQDFSVAGKRAGMDGARGNLSRIFIDIVDQYRPRWIVWENVPGLLSSNEGRDFGAFLGALGECGYGLDYRILDAQYFGVPQRRRRVFVVGYFGDWRPATAVLLERHCLQGDFTPGKKAGEDVAGTLRSGTPGRGGLRDFNDPAAYIPQTTHALTARHDSSEDGCGRGTPIIPTHDISPCLQERGYKGADSDCTQAYVIHQNQEGQCYLSGQAHSLGTTQNASARSTAKVMTVYPLDLRNASRDAEKHDAMNRQGLGVGKAGAPAPTLTNAFTPGVAMVYENHGQDSRIKQVGVCPQLNAKAGTGGGNLPLVQTNMAVRRLTPRECERLMGLPDDYTLIPYNGKLASDGPRYKAIGNSIAVPVLRWIGERINQVEAIIGLPPL